MELSSSNIKKILIFSQEEVFLIFSQKKALLIFWKQNFVALILKKDSFYFFKNPFYLFSYISKNEPLQFSAQPLKIKEHHPRKMYHTSGNGNPEKKKIIFNFLHQNVFVRTFCLNFFHQIFLIRIFFFIRIFNQDFLHHNQRKFLYHQ